MNSADLSEFSLKFLNVKKWESNFSSRIIKNNNFLPFTSLNCTRTLKINKDVPNFMLKSPLSTKK